MTWNMVKMKLYYCLCVLSLYVSLFIHVGKVSLSLFNFMLWWPFDGEHCFCITWYNTLKLKRTFEALTVVVWYGGVAEEIKENCITHILYHLYWDSGVPSELCYWCKNSLLQKLWNESQMDINTLENPDHILCVK